MGNLQQIGHNTIVKKVIHFDHLLLSHVLGLLIGCFNEKILHAVHVKEIFWANQSPFASK